MSSTFIDKLFKLKLYVYLSFLVNTRINCLKFFMIVYSFGFSLRLWDQTLADFDHEIIEFDC